MNLVTRKRAAAAASALAIALVLAGCTASDDTATNGGEKTAAPSVTDECTTAGDASDSISVTGDFNAEPVVDFKDALTTDRTERSAVIEGDGTEVAKDGFTVDVAYSLYHGGTGELLDSSGYGNEGQVFPFAVDEAQYVDGIVRALNCSVEGDRVVALIPPTDLWGDTGNEQLGVTADDSVFFIFDVLGVTPPVDAAADMVTVKPDAEGMPSVAYAADGTPTVTIPDGEPTGDLALAVIEEGDGDVVGDGDSVEVNYTGINWTSGEEFDSSWTRGQTATFATDGVVTGFGAALVGQKVGAKLVVVIPPLYGYGTAGNAGAGIAGTDTIVFAVDILGVTPK
ncbi:peptidylprolyl isomerase [Homoserinimonas aerilata]|uniref:peptidylprolyl isomerase n=1 Tax=Homoserinimonas aerilata TaxID=1162970 RepID=A0A542YHP3_9MICO|nr:FKBP-type peptidyl-prolyl cis-trans isomerase [Homoserinimonas aerilata]TQL47620.1 peptidylprolyl isomerase [Homoserinimonas aerilata]